MLLMKNILKFFGKDILLINIRKMRFVGEFGVLETMEFTDLPFIVCPQKMHCSVPRQTQHSHISTIITTKHTMKSRVPFVAKL